MNIAFISLSPINPLIGGIERITYNLSIELKKRGCNVYNFCIRGEEDSTNFILSPQANPIEQQLYFSKKIKENNINIIIDQYGYALNILKKENFPHIIIFRCIHTDVTERNITRRLLGEWPYISTKRKIMNLAFWLNTPLRKRKEINNLRKVEKNVDKIVLLSPSYKPELIKKGFHSNNLITIPNGIIPSEHNNFKKSNVLLFCGRIQHNPKNVFFLIDVWETISEKYPQWELYIAGGGIDLNKMKSIAKQKNLSRIHFPGFVDPSELYEKAKILLLPSFTEGFAMVLLEAMEHKCVPIVFDNSPAFQDIIENYTTGIIVKKMNKQDYIKECERLINSPHILDKMGNAASRSIEEKFTIQKIADIWMEQFRNTAK